MWRAPAETANLSGWRTWSRSGLSQKSRRRPAGVHRSKGRAERRGRTFWAATGRHGRPQPETGRRAVVSSAPAPAAAQI